MQRTGRRGARPCARNKQTHLFLSFLSFLIVLLRFIWCFVWATWERLYNITSIFTVIPKPPSPPNHVIFPDGRTTPLWAPPPPPPPSCITTNHYSSAVRLCCAAYVKNRRNSGAIAFTYSGDFPRICDHGPAPDLIANAWTDAIRSDSGLSIDIWFREGRPRGVAPTAYGIVYNGLYGRVSRPYGIVLFLIVFRVGHVGASVQYHIHIYSYTQTSFTPKPRHLSGRTHYAPSGPTPTSATIVHHHQPLQLGRSAVLRSLHK